MTWWYRGMTRNYHGMPQPKWPMMACLDRFGEAGAALTLTFSSSCSRPIAPATSPCQSREVKARVGRARVGRARARVGRARARFDGVDERHCRRH